MSRRIAGVAAAAGLLLAGCSSSPSAPAQSDGASAGAGSTPGSVPGSITVFAAASLQRTFTALGKSFEAAHPGTKVTLSFGGSSDLATQIDADAPGDVFASASTKTMATVVRAGHATNPGNFARNDMEIATPAGNPDKIASLADLARSGVKVVLCQAKVPCGDTAVAIFAKAGIKVTPVTYEKDVKSTLAKIASGEVDAGLVYVTDVLAAGSKVSGVQIPDASNLTTDYPIAVLRQSKHIATAQAFVDYIHSGDALAVLAAAGFMSP